MSNHTLTRIELTNIFSRQLLLSHGKSVLLVEAIIQQILYALHANNHLKISSFGTFIVHEKDKRKGRNPKTGKEAVIVARRSLSFRASQILKKKISTKMKQADFVRESQAQGNFSEQDRPL